MSVKKIKRIHILIAIVMFFGSICSASYAINSEVEEIIPPFKDVTLTHWGINAIKWNSNAGNINGYPDGTFKPENSLTKAEFAVIFSKAFKKEYDSLKQTFSDVDLDHWAFKQVEGISPYVPIRIKDGEKLFEPNEPATREYVAVTLAIALNLNTDVNIEQNLERFIDKDLILSTYEKYIATIVKNQIMKGSLNEKAETVFNPKGKITRVEIAQIIYNLLVSLTDKLDQKIAKQKSNKPSVAVTSALEALAEIQEEYDNSNAISSVLESLPPLVEIESKKVMGKAAPESLYKQNLKKFKLSNIELSVEGKKYEIPVYIFENKYYISEQDSEKFVDGNFFINVAIGRIDINENNVLVDLDEIETKYDNNYFDSDYDFLSDQDERAIGTNPSVQDSDNDGIKDCYEVFYQTMIQNFSNLNTSSLGFVKNITLSFVGDGYINSSSLISKAYDIPKKVTNAAGTIGEPFYVNTVSDFQKPLVTVLYETSLLSSISPENVGVMFLDPKSNKLKLIKTLLDTTKNTISFNPSVFGSFVFVDQTKITSTELDLNEIPDINELEVKNNEMIYDIVVYGGTSAGVIAACKASREKMSVLLISPERHLGGMTSSGLGLTDSSNKEDIGGMAKDFYALTKMHYFDTLKTEYGYTLKNKKQLRKIITSKIFEPHVAENVFNNMIKYNNVSVVYNKNLNMSNGVTKTNKKITSITMETGEKYYGKIFVDATYEGDLMSKSGVSYTVGRESNSLYSENNNGFQYYNEKKSDQLPLGISPYIDPQNPSLGFLKGLLIEEPITVNGTGDSKLQAYCYRMCLTDDITNMVDYKDENKDKKRDKMLPPLNYNKDLYEVLLRYIEKEKDGRLSKENFNKWYQTLFTIDLMPNAKTDTNNCGPFSTDFIGYNHSYINADYNTRKSIQKEHEDYQRGLLWTIQFSDDPRVPKYLKEFYQKYGLAKDEFTDNNNWPYQLYIREGRRMVSDYVMTEKNCSRELIVEDSIGKGTYAMDSHGVQRIVVKIDGEYNIQNEGNHYLGDKQTKPFPISYRSICPKKDECTNLLVPVALSATHISFGAIRMEPTFMILAESAVAAAKIALTQNNGIIQEVNYQSLKDKLITDGQIIN